MSQLIIGVKTKSNTPRNDTHASHDDEHDHGQVGGFLPSRPGNLAQFADRFAEIALNAIGLLRRTTCSFLPWPAEVSFWSGLSPSQAGNYTPFLISLRVKRRPYEDGVAHSRQARQELNPQPPLLESGALPIELLAYSSRPVTACLQSDYTPNARLRDNETMTRLLLLLDAACACGSAGSTC